ncbi:RNA polymerase sigma factor [Paraclostridium sordellii]|uniref:RNA polymerase sigma factor n=1 Tax=Paraclostridium sordellii TaxID=1505 RepID=UPI003A88E85B
MLELPHKYKMSIYLFYYEGYSTEEIAQILDTKPSTVRSNLHRGRKLLKISLGSDYINEG